MLMLKTKIAKVTMGLIVTSIISAGAILPVSAMESQPNLDNNSGIKAQCEVMKESCTNEHAAAQFTLNENGEKVLTVTPKSDFRSHNENKSDFKWDKTFSKDGKCETPVVAVETPVMTPVVAVETPVMTPVVAVETPVVKAPVVKTPVVETPVITPAAVTPAAVTPVIDEDPADESVQNGFYSHLLDAYDKLLTLYDKLLNSFSTATAI